MLMRIKGIKPVTVRKKGQIYRYYYHRATNKRILAPFGTAAFAAEVATLDIRAKELTPQDGSLQALIIAYRKSPEFTQQLKPRTRSDYDRFFDYLIPLGGMPVSAIDTAFIYKLRDQANSKHKRRFANYLVAVVRLLFSWGKPRGFVDSNPAEGVKAIPRPKQMPRANRPWADHERETVLSAARIEVRTMIALGMFAGLREGDACSLLKTAYDGRSIELTASKNGEPVSLPVHFRLREILQEAAEARKLKLKHRSRRYKVIAIDPPTLAVTSRGSSWTEAGLRASFFKLIRTLAGKGLIGSGLTFHGLRHTMGKLVIEAGGSTQDVKMILGDRSDAMGEFYSREHEKKNRITSTMELLERDERMKLQNNGIRRGHS